MALQIIYICIYTPLSNSRRAVDYHYQRITIGVIGEYRESGILDDGKVVINNISADAVIIKKLV